MPVSINNTTLTFNDGTTMTSRPVTSVTGAGTVSVSASTGAVTITGTGGTGTVTSVATGNGLSGGTITTSGTLTLACPGFNTVGSYCYVWKGSFGANINTTGGTNYSAGSGQNQVRSFIIVPNASDSSQGANLSGTWKWMAGDWLTTSDVVGIACRVS